MKVVKEMLKWLACVFLSFTVIFTLIKAYDDGIEGVYCYILNHTKTETIEQGMDEYAHYLEDRYGVGAMEKREEPMEDYIEDEHGNMIKVETPAEELTEYQKHQTEMTQKYPTGYAMASLRYSLLYRDGNALLLSFICGVIIGTAVYLLLDKKKKGIKAVIAVYFLSVGILGFVQGIENSVEDKFQLRWEFPIEYILPITLAFGLVIAVRIIRKKEIASKLNQKLQERKSHQ